MSFIIFLAKDCYIKIGSSLKKVIELQCSAQSAPLRHWRIKNPLDGPVGAFVFFAE